MFLAIFMIMGMNPADSAATTFQLDPVHHFISFKVEHFWVSYVRARFNDVTGTITADEKGVQSLKLVIKAASIDTGNAERDQGLASAFWLDAGKWPDITFTSSSIQKSDKGMMISGELSLHGVTKNVRIEAQVNGPLKDPLGKTRIGLNGLLIIDREDFGIILRKPKTDRPPIVGTQLEIEILIEAIAQE